MYKNDEYLTNRSLDLTIKWELGVTFIRMRAQKIINIISRPAMCIWDIRDNNS